MGGGAEKNRIQLIVRKIQDLDGIASLGCTFPPPCCLYSCPASPHQPMTSLPCPCYCPCCCCCCPESPCAAWWFPAAPTFLPPLHCLPLQGDINGKKWRPAIEGMLLKWGECSVLVLVFFCSCYVWNIHLQTAFQPMVACEVCIVANCHLTEFLAELIRSSEMNVAPTFIKAFLSQNGWVFFQLLKMGTDISREYSVDMMLEGIVVL